ncbi:hypothetical protein Micbo1qcDRAFT_166911 [Microdochium bolleyi]|uniref:Uncharacterized protein n=1 Tax=Microdochium bolleyi TaxID=196109 RepID=A0A136ITN0_9PEZI|nr:hypothetical protein Micbo1qcDRAFT_166911 [Microdochium bolleyi]
MPDTSSLVYPAGSHHQSCTHFTGCRSEDVCGRNGKAGLDESKNQVLTAVQPRDHDHDDDESTTMPQSTKTRTATTTKDEDDSSTTGGVFVISPPMSESTEKATTTTKKTSPTPSTKTSKSEQETSVSTREPSATSLSVPTTTVPDVTQTVFSSPTSTPDAGTTMPPVLPPGPATPTGGNLTSPATPSAGADSGAKDSSVTAIAAGVGGAVGALIILAIVFYLIRKRRHAKRMSSVRGSSPLNFDEKIGTAEGGPGIRASLRDPLPTGPIEFLPQNQTSMGSASANNRSYHPTPPADTQAEASQYFRAGSLVNRNYPHAGSSQPVTTLEPAVPLVSPMTPIGGYGRDGVPMMSTEAVVPHEHLGRTQNPAQYAIAAAHGQPQRPSRGDNCHHEHEGTWTDPNAIASGQATRRTYDDPANYVSPMSPDFTVPPAPTRAQFPSQQNPQFSSQPTRKPAPYMTYMNGASRSSSANSSHNTHNTGYGYYQGPQQTHTPPPGALRAQDRVPSGPSRSISPRAEAQEGFDFAPQRHRKQPEVPVQGRPRLVHINSGTGVSNPDRVPTPANSAELQGSEVGVAIGANAEPGRPMSVPREHSKGRVPSATGSQAGHAYALQVHQVDEDVYRPFAGADHQQHPAQLTPGPHQTPAGFRGDMNATETDRQHDQFVTSWQKL